MPKRPASTSRQTPSGKSRKRSTSKSRRHSSRASHPPLGRGGIPYTPAEINAAKAAWDSLPLSAKIEILEDLLRTRYSEWQRIDPGITAIHYGYQVKTYPTKTAKAARRTRTAGQAKAEVLPPLCLKFTVQRKRSRVRTDQCIPKLILALAHSSNGKTLVAIPTDVNAEKMYEAKLHLGYAAVAAGTNVAAGVLTCRVTDNVRDNDLILSCAHVYGASAHNLGAWPTGAAVTACNFQPNHIVPTPPHVADVDSARGNLAPGDNCFDAAFAILKSSGNPTALLAPGITDIVTNAVAVYLASNVVVKTARGELPGKVHQLIPTAQQFALAYYNGAFHARQKIDVLHCLLDATPLEGDSGSPILTADRRTLIGMHFAGNAPGNLYLGKYWSYSIPAYELFRVENYNNTLPPGSKLTLFKS